LRVHIEADSQAEFDKKRLGLIQHLAGTTYDVVAKSRISSVYSKQKPAIAERKGYFKAQNEMIAYWDGKWAQTLKNIKRDVAKVIDE
jgi:hypothetical protein